jgi:hypothetical protein
VFIDNNRTEFARTARDSQWRNICSQLDHGASFA